MKEYISAQGLNLGATEDGKNWCLKALHPSDPVTEVRGIPDEDASPTVFLNYQTVAKLSASAGATGTWSFDAALLPHPVQFMALDYTDSYGHILANSSAVYNAQLDGTTHSEKFASFRNMARRWRLAYMAVTVHQDGPALSDQGTLVVAQVPQTPKLFSYCQDFISPVAGGPVVVAHNRIAQYTFTDEPDFKSSQAMPNAYFNNSRYGAYVPLKLTETCQDWVSDSDNIIPAAFSPDMGWTEEALAGQGPRRGGYIVLPQTVLEAQANRFYPFRGSDNLEPAWTVPAQTGIDTGSFGGHCTSAMCNGLVAHISAENLSVATSYTFFIRAGFEIQVQPLSTMSPHQKLSPKYDPVAIQSYFAIARELKDAYPADYNDLGKILKVIGDAAAFAGPIIGMIPHPVAKGIGLGLASGGSLLSSYGGSLNPTMAAEEKQMSLSAGQIDRARKAQTVRNIASLQREVDPRFYAKAVNSRPQTKKRRRNRKARVVTVGRRDVLVNKDGRISG